MAKQSGDVFTLDLLSKPGRGRPRKPDAKTPAQRAREYRARKRAAKLAKQARYRCPLTGSTWSGRGKPPKWVEVALKYGKTLADFDTHVGR